MKNWKCFPAIFCVLALVSGAFSAPNDDEDIRIVKVNDSNFEQEILQSDKPTILEFSSTSCPPCLIMIPTLISIAKNYPDIKVASVGIDEPGIEKIKNTSSNYNYGFYINGNTIYSEGATTLHSGYVYINTEYLEKVVLLSNHTGIKDFDETAKNVYNKLNSKINGIIINQIDNG